LTGDIAGRAFGAAGNSLWIGLADRFEGIRGGSGAMKYLMYSVIALMISIVGVLVLNFLVPGHFLGYIAAYGLIVVFGLLAFLLITLFIADRLA
jgi:hypothetical protein